MSKPLVLIGCGKMGGAMLAGWLESGEATGGVHVVEPHAAAMGVCGGVPRAIVWSRAHTQLEMQTTHVCVCARATEGDL